MGDCLYSNESDTPVASCSALESILTNLPNNVPFALDPQSNLYVAHTTTNENDEDQHTLFKVDATVQSLAFTDCGTAASCTTFHQSTSEIQNLTTDGAMVYWTTSDDTLKRMAFSGDNPAEVLLVDQQHTKINKVFVTDNNILSTSFQSLLRGRKADALHAQSHTPMNGVTVMDLHQQGNVIYLLQSQAIGMPQVIQTRLADSVCKQRLAILQANTNDAQMNKGLILPNGDSLLAGQGENVLGISTQGIDGVLVHKTFESKNKTVLRLLSKTQSSAITTEAFVHVETDPVNHHRAALASFCADLNPVENCSALLMRNDDEGVFVGQGSDYGKAGLVLKLNSDLTTQWAREILPASGSTLTPVQTQVGSDGSLYVLVNFKAISLSRRTPITRLLIQIKLFLVTALRAPQLLRTMHWGV